MQIDGSTQIVGVLGSPIAHTASPAMHNAAFKALKLNWKYLAFHVEPANLANALRGVRDMNFQGVNLTVPHKVLALNLVDEADPDARQLGAVNTIAVREGRLLGFNTDGFGFARAIREEFDLELKNLRVLVLGAGGAGRAIALQCAHDGAAKVIVANRTLAHITPIAVEMARTSTAFAAVELNPPSLDREIKSVDLLVNATSIGLKEGESLGLDPGLFHRDLAVYDTIYRPAELNCSDRLPLPVRRCATV